MAEKTPLRLACEGYAECVGSCPYDIHLYEPWAESCYEKCSANIDYAECWERYFMQKSEKGHLMYINNPIEKLRAWVRATREDGLGPLGTNLKELEEITDMIEAEFEARREAAAFFEAERDRLYKVLADMKRTHMKLPVDADGAPIRPGDYMQMAFGESAEVVAVDSERWFFDQSCLDDDSEEYEWEWAVNSRHFKLDIVEGLLEEFERRYALCLHIDYTGDDTPGGLREEYAERIRKAVHDGD